jgi:hypothetical protein
MPGQDPTGLGELRQPGSDKITSGSCRQDRATPPRPGFQGHRGRSISWSPTPTAGQERIVMWYSPGFR